MAGDSDKKVACVVGATGKQGGSVARRFLQAGFRVRAVTRDPASPAAAQLAASGAQLVTADLGDVASLEAAFAGANLIFSVTNYWEPFYRQDCRETARGKNIADAAAATVGSLHPNGFLVSTLSHAEKCSGGRLKELHHFDAKADVFPHYVQDKHPALAAKMSCIHTGYFFTSFNILPKSYFAKREDGSIEMTFPTAPHKPVPHLDPVGDMGSFVYAVHQLPPGKAFMAAGTTCTWPEFLETWGRAAGYPVHYRQVTPDEMIAATPDTETGIEVAAMFSYTSDPGYDGGMELLTADDMRKAGIECPMTTWEDWAGRQDWKDILAKLG
ncbi:nmrA-like family domain-containing protein [Hirsutella rhossiliensis]|uniref:NmrA-like family domain-containing protein n=1 Tax=Hirsutella rhossiliensis TaxID=111463 RepID=A0A9P8SHF0_9HYPO|nr:nmrA-like family domain-containing protein [Hirsutella rhossiliensis]KAH0961475.1 nmrA-like family domain-containing protein [Hirsutella rhossiliensis]